MAITRRTGSLLCLRIVARRGSDPGRLHDVLRERVEPRIAEEIRTAEPLAAASTDLGVVAVFASIPEAAKCALCLRDFFRDENWKDHGVVNPVQAKIALHSGRVALADTPLTGGAVESVAALCYRTPPGELWATAEFCTALTAEGDTRFGVQRVETTGVEANGVFALLWAHERPRARWAAADESEVFDVPLTAPILSPQSLRNARPGDGPHQPSESVPPEPSPAGLSFETGATPRRVFISYSWDSDEHKRWVERLAVTLRHNGVDARIDRWRRQTQSIPEFMSSEVRNADKIVILCTPELQRKVHATEDGERPTGAGWESGLVTGAVFAGAASKVIAVLVRGTWLEAAPSWLQGHAYINMTNPADLKPGVLELIRQIIGETPAAPALGRLPEGIRDEPAEPLF